MFLRSILALALALTLASAYAVDRCQIPAAQSDFANLVVREVIDMSAERTALLAAVAAVTAANPPDKAAQIAALNTQFHLTFLNRAISALSAAQTGLVAPVLTVAQKKIAAEAEADALVDKTTAATPVILDATK